LGAVARGLGDDTMDYRSGVSPREKLDRDVYTSTELAPDLTLPLHNEMSFARSWPLRLLFHCVVPSRSGGQSPIADSRAVLRDLDPAVRERFSNKGVLYVRNYGSQDSNEDISWRQAFETDERSEVDAFCQREEIEVEWLSADHLRTRRLAPAIRQDVTTGDEVWFNQAHLFHSTTLERVGRLALLARHGPEGLARNALYGDGSPIPGRDIAKVRAAFDANTYMFDWERGDLLVLSNMTLAHGRMPFEGDRRVLVSMARPYSGA
jgi:hypothetical protein